MITLITGLPGNGKTLYALQYVADLAKKENRLVYYYGINGLAPELGWFQLDAKDEYVQGEKNPPVQVPQWWDVPARAIVLIDEAQMCGFGVRPRGQVPIWAQKLETHRHLGLDLVMITQDPSLIDSHDRKLAELHFHVMRTFGMQRATIHEFRPVRQNVLASRKGSIEHRWKYPAKVFAWYKSAEAHTHKRRVPMKLVVLLCLPILIGGLGYVAWSKYLSPNRDSLKVAQSAAAPGAPGQAAGGTPVGGGKMDTTTFLKQFVPRVPGLEYTAPAYDEITKPVVAPYPAACVQSSTLCLCYTQQGTRLQTPSELCKGIVAGGFFVAWDKPLQAGVPMQQVKAERERKEEGGAVSFGGTRKWLEGSSTTSITEGGTARQKTRAGSQPAPQG